MNSATKEIAELANVSLEEALVIQNTIDRNWMLDWSECTQREFETAVKSAVKLVNFI